MTQAPASSSDPRDLNLMQGFPPPRDKVVKASDGTGWRFPNLRWAFSHQRELVPTVNVWKGPGAASPLPVSLRDDLDDVAFTSLEGEALTFGQAFDVNCTDGLLILHRGEVIYERYDGALEANRQHLAMSVTKSFVGLIATMLVHDGLLDPTRLVPHYLPEMAATAYGDATVRDVMDMTIGVKYSETYTDPKADIWQYTVAAGLTARPEGYSGPEQITDFLLGLKKEGVHDHAFAYKTCNTEVLAWIIQRATGRAFADLLSERIWQKLGAENDAYIGVDPVGMAMCGGGMNMTLRDMARFGEMMRLGGKWNGQQIVPQAVVTDIAGGADPSKFARAGYAKLAGWSYRAQWWNAHDRFGAYTARGIHGQVIWIAPGAELVIARFASHHTAGNGNGPLDDVSLPSYAAIAEHLTKSESDPVADLSPADHQHIGRRRWRDRPL